MIDYTASLSYFALTTHPRAPRWAAAGENACTAAIAAARRMLGRALGRELDDDEAAYVEGDRTRDEYAVYEQALWILENGVIANGDGSAPMAEIVGASARQAPSEAQAQREAFAPEALRWLGWGGMVTIRG